MRALAKPLQSRTVARFAIAALALGLFALAGLALWGANQTERDSDRLNEINEIAARWGSLFEALNVQDAAAGDYLNAGDEVGRRPLESALTLGEYELGWLAEHSEPDEQDEVTLVADAYHSYTATLNDLVRLGRQGDLRRVMLRGKAAALMADTLRKQLTANIAHRRLQISDHLAKAQRTNERLRTAGVTTFAVDAVLLLFCSLVLLGYQRRVERQAAESGHQALHDALTGLPNRVLLHNRLEQAVQGTGPDGAAVALLLIDLDRFKEVNDTLGHHFGDLLLQTVATRLVSAVRSGDTVARLGGDEFAVLMPEIAGVTEADRLARRILHALRQPAELEGIPIDVDGSIGVAVYPDHSHDADQLLQHADIAMYTAKRGRLGTATYNPQDDDTSGRNLAMLGDLRRALDRGELVLHYQPQRDLETGVVLGVEALVRWQHEDHGLLLPEEFLPAVEDSGLIERLTEYVLGTALDQCHRWAADGRRLPISVNAAARCLLDPAFPDLVVNLLADRHVAADLLTLEFPQKALRNPSPDVQDVLVRLRAAGVRLSVDDFCHGWDAAAELRTLPLQQLKVDAGLIAGLADERIRSRVAGIVALGRDNQLQVLAEGVNDEETFARARALGCRSGQGHWLGTPQPARDITSLLAGHDLVVHDRTGSTG